MRSTWLPARKEGQGAGPDAEGARSSGRTDRAGPPAIPMFLQRDGGGSPGAPWGFRGGLGGAPLRGPRPTSDPLHGQLGRDQESDGGPVATDLAGRIALGRASGGQMLAPRARDRLESSLGVELSAVRVHSDETSDALARSVNARAFTTGSDIFMRRHAYDDASPAGMELLAHETVHAVQQSRGPVSGRPGPGGVSVSDPGDPFEREAKQIAREFRGDRGPSAIAERGGPARQGGPLPAGPGAGGAPSVQRDDPPTAGDGVAVSTPASGEGAAQAVAASGPPILWGLDMSSGSGTLYMSVTVPGHTLAEVATYAYGSAAMAGALAAANGGAPENLPPGRTLRPADGTLTETAHQALQSATDQGAILRSQGMPTETSDTPMVYTFAAGGRSYRLTGTQFVGMMQGAATWIERKARFLRDSAADGRWVHHDHRESTNRAIRWISDTVGGTSLPDESIWDPAENGARAVFDAIHGQTMTEQSQPLLAQQLAALQTAARALDDAEATWHQYIEATISGAGSTVHALEITRNVSFGIAAGLAGAIAAPAVFAAAGGGLLGGGLAIGAGAAAGAATDATLEFTGAVGGQGLSMAITPGPQSFDWGYVGDRTAEGARSGAIQGGIGAAGALAAPGVSNAIANRLYGTGTAGLTTTGARMTVNALTGTAIGAPSGAAGAALENAGAYARGDISGGQYAASIGLGAGVGGAGGAAFSFLPVNGLYRTGGQPYNPFSGTPVTPRWMLAGFGGPLSRGAFQAGWNPPVGFEQLPLSDLPPLLEGYTWMDVGGRFEPMAINGAMNDPVTVRMYGPDPQGRFNYNFYQNGRLIGSRAFTRPAGATFQGVPGAGRNNYPMTTADYTDPVTGQRYVRGHNIDFGDTSQPPGATASDLSTMDPLNFTPEEADWGLHVRRLLVGQIRNASGAQGQYRQIEFNDPGSPVRVTTNGRRIPDGVYFAEYDSATGQPVRAYLVRYAQSAGFRTLADAARYQIPVAQLPPVLRSAPMISLPVGGAGGTLAEADGGAGP